MTFNKTSVLHHIRTAAYRSELAHDKITGFHLQKMTKGGKYRLRYQMPSDKKQKLITLGKYFDGSKDLTDTTSKAREYIVQIKQGNDPAIEIERKVESDIAERKAKKEEQKNLITVNEYLQGIYTAHQARKKNAGKPTLDMINRAFKTWLDKPLSELNRSMVLAWQTEYEKTHAYDTCKRVYGAIKTMLNHAVKSEVITFNPIDKVQLEKPTFNEQEKKQQSESANKRRILTKDELTKINNAIESYRQKLIDGREQTRKRGKPHYPSFKNIAYPNWFFPFFKLAAYSGMRTGDLYNLQWHHINFDEARLVKVPNKTQHHHDPIKLDIHLNPRILESLKAWHEQKGLPKDGLVFPSPKTGNELSKDAHEKHWKHVMEFAKLGENLVFYSLRHHFISRLLEENVPLFTVARLAGHKSTAMIEKIYGKVSKDAANDALSTISNDFA